MSYSWITRAQARLQLAQRLGDTAAATGQSYWSPDELNAYLAEALRCWNCAANYFTRTGTFTTTYGQAWYDLTAELTALANTTTDREVVNLMEWHLLEPITTSWPTWTGTEQFAMSDLVDALQRRRNQFLEDTGIHIGLPTEIPAIPAANGIVQLADNVLQVRRVAWKAPDGGGNLSASQGVFTQLPRTDTANANAQLAGWSVTGSMPRQYIPYYATLLTNLQLVPRPNDIGRVEVVTVNAGPTLNVSTGVVLGMDDDFIPYVKWGALADLLNREGLANDPQRAQYGEQRYREGVELGKLTFSLVQAKLNGVPIPQLALDDFDNGIGGWQNQVSQPMRIAAANSTLVALHPVPDDVYSVECQVVSNAEIPASDGAFVQVGREFLDAVLGEAQHIASFKLGGQEFTNSFALHEQMFRLAATYNQILAANLSNFDIIGSSGTRETSLRPAA